MYIITAVIIYIMKILLCSMGENMNISRIKSWDVTKEIERLLGSMQSFISMRQGAGISCLIKTHKTRCLNKLSIAEGVNEMCVSGPSWIAAIFAKHFLPITPPTPINKHHSYQPDTCLHARKTPALPSVVRQGCPLLISHTDGVVICV
jgi:hypothetical protein